MDNASKLAMRDISIRTMLFMEIFVNNALVHAKFAQVRFNAFNAQMGINLYNLNFL
jgi:hypothetical protein